MNSITPTMCSATFFCTSPGIQKDNAPSLTPAMEEDVHSRIDAECKDYKGIRLLKLGGTMDHIHAPVQIEPFVTTSEFVKQIKGSSARGMNQKHGRGTLKWRRGYDALNYARMNLPALKNYVSNQKEMHRQRRTNKVLGIYDRYFE